MIAPVTLAQMIEDTRIAAARDAVVARLGAMLRGVTVTAHPGKLDINDVVAKAIVAAPGVAVGYTRVRELADPGGTFTLGIDFAAYIVVEDLVDRSQGAPRTTGRETVGHAIGLQVLRILRDPDAASWGLAAIEPPAMDPPPTLSPLFTMKTQENMTALYAVTWMQGLVQEGESWFDRGAPIDADFDAFPEFPASDDEVEFLAPNIEPGLDPNLLPSEILARFRLEDPEGDP